MTLLINKEYKNILYKMEYVHFPQSLKVIALPNAGMGPFENIGIFMDKYSRHIPNGNGINIGMYTNLINDNFDYYFGQWVTNLEEVPEGLVGLDTHTTNFAVLTVCANTMFELVGDDTGPGDAMHTAEEYMQTVWLPNHRDIAVTDERGDCGKVLIDGKIYHTGNFEVYLDTDDSNPQMQFYIPLKNDINFNHLQ